MFFKNLALVRRTGVLTSLMLAFILTAKPAASEEIAPPPIVKRVCAMCHGIDGNSKLPRYPKLAGQSASYISRQLSEFIVGNRKHPEMTPIAEALEAKDIDVVAEYFSQQKATPGKPETSQLNEIGKLLYTIGNPNTGLPSCDGCHSPDGSGGGRFPRLAGQHREYLAKQIADMKESRRIASPLMKTVAERMGELEMKALSVYLSGL